MCTDRLRPAADATVAPPRDLVLTLAYGSVCEAPAYRVFLRSFQHVRRDGLCLVVFAADLTEHTLAMTRETADEVIPLLPGFEDIGNKERHWYFARYLSREWKRFDRAMIVDATDTVFQSDPFGTIPLPPTLDVVMLSAEGGAVQEEAWNQKDAQLFSTALRVPWSRVNPNPFCILNGGFMAGSAGRMAAFTLTRFALDVRCGSGTDQSSLTALGNWTLGWPGFTIVTHATPWVLHGHWFVTLSARGEVRASPDGLVLEATSGRPYALFHQWDRTPLSSAVLERFRV
jgi:hypothetical protein